MSSLLDRLRGRSSGLALYGLAPPKRATDPERLATIADRQVQRLQRLQPDGVIVYDLQDEPGRTGEPRPFPFLPTVDPHAWAGDHLGAAGVPAVVYRSVAQDTPETFGAWLDNLAAAPDPRAAVFVGSPTRRTDAAMGLPQAYALARAHASDLVFGGIAIAERHARRGDEHERILTKLDEGCRFFVSQAVYDVTATKSLLSDVYFALQEHGREPMPMVLTFSPCASLQTLAFMKWLGISFPRWLENELRWARDPLATSVALCEAIFAEAWEFARAKDIPLGVNVESVSIRKEEIEASEALLLALRARMEGS